MDYSKLSDKELNLEIGRIKQTQDLYINYPFLEDDGMTLRAFKELPCAALMYGDEYKGWYVNWGKRDIRYFRDQNSNRAIWIAWLTWKGEETK